MSNDLKENAFFYKDVCLFCGKKAEEHYFSGSYDTYLDCECEARKKYYEHRRIAETVEREASEKYNSMKEEEEIASLKTRLKYLESKRK